MATDSQGDNRFFAGLLVMAVVALIALGVTIFPQRDHVPEPTAATGGGREVPAPGNPPVPVAPDTPAPDRPTPAPESK